MAKKRSRSNSDSGSESEASMPKDEDGSGSDSDSDSDNNSMSSSSTPSKKKKSKKEKKHKKSKKHKKEKKEKKKKKKKKEKKEKKEKKSKDPPTVSSTNVFGSRGVVRASDMSKYQRSFEAWLGEVKGIPCFTGPKYELAEYFKEFAEDFNTCTFPHEKYYDYDKWEADEWRKQASGPAGASSAVSDEARHNAEKRRIQAEKREQEMRETKERMAAKGSLTDLRQQDLLKATMAQAFKTGDTKAVERIKKRLEPDAPDKGPKHP
eukprot:CAMPEP_0197571548 /NCGR_PEP_ID=MMETSP1320-20131121/42012_1 /TAXON_ID=91990 /ORGANISM="Bolidomonas sp., Strain RCC2347" /LENGTH=263 /DNA_ID=CAMNT_0043134041 /DNA_START=209 /DNA_END=997 /DNA_ORIENTATION=+